MVGPQSLWPVWRADLPQGKQIEIAAMIRLRLWSSYLDPDVAHSRRVAQLARQLFDGLTRANLAPLSPNQDLRSVLQAAALMHDVGRSKRDKQHHKASYRLIRRMTAPLGLSSSQLQLAAIVSRFHRGELPTLRHKALRDLALDQKKIALHLAGILRLANALDSHSAGGIGRVFVEADEKALTIRAQGYNPWTRAAEKNAGAAYLLALILRRSILIKAAPRARPKETTRSSRARPR